MYSVSSSIKLKTRAAFIVLTLLLLVLVLISFALWQRERSTSVVTNDTGRPSREENNEPESTTADAQADALLVTSTSNELSAIEADLVSTDLSNLHSEFTAIEAEFTNLGQ